MPTIEQQPIATQLQEAASNWKVWLPLAAFAVLWLDLCRQLSYMWSTNEQYAYGWFVPVLALGLFIKKWPSRPRAQTTDHGTTDDATTGLRDHGPQTTRQLTTGRPSMGSVVSGQWSVVSLLVVVIAFAILPLRLIHEINQDWSFCSYLLTLVVVVLSLYAVHLAGPAAASDQRPEGRGQRAEVGGQKSVVSRQWSVVSRPWSVVRRPWSVVSPWVKHFAFPICFILVAVNWPYRIENSLKHRMMNAVSGITVEIIGWLNIPALQHGNVIELTTGSVGVDDACSGIRSLQSTIMAGLFLGELYLLKWPRRLLLVALGLPLAFAFNIVRTLFLTWRASAAGESAVAKWHDSAGMTISIICFGCLWLVALALRQREKGADHGLVTTDRGTTGLRDHGLKTTDHRTTGLPDSLSAGGEGRGEVASAVSRQPSVVGSPAAAVSAQWSVVSSPVVSSPVVHSPVVSGQLSVVGNQSSVVSSPAAVVSGQWSVVSKYLLACGIWSLVCIGVTEGWYRAHETDPAQTVRWSAQFPTNSPSARKIGIDKEVRQVLKCDSGDGLAWEEPDGGKWSAYFFRWRAGEATSRMAARDHRPEICLPSTGYKVQADLGIHYLPAQGLELPFRAYTFADGGRVLYVFFCLWEDGAEKQTGLGRSKYLDRLDSVLAGRRRLGQQTLEIVVSGYADMAEAESALRQRLPSLVQVGNG